MRAKIVIAPDKFKGSLSAVEAAAAISRGIRKSYPEAECVELPIADGGEGTMELISQALEAEPVDVDVTGPFGDAVTASYAIARRKTAIMEMSAASGLALVAEEGLDPWEATTFGTGEMILDALLRGAEKVVVGIGGSATNDGGAGMAEALGYLLRRSTDGALVDILPPKTHPSEQAKFVTACDVSNPLLGPVGCTRVYGPQKGIAAEDFGRHEARLRRLAEIVARDVADVSPDTPGAGAAGGLGFGLMAFCGAELRSGFDLVAELTGLEQQIASADLVITGEGSMDAQTLMGKGPAGVADLARASGKKVLAVCGVAHEKGALLERFDDVTSLAEESKSVEDSMARAAELLESVAARIKI